MNDAGLYVIKCTTSGSPPTTVIWTRNSVIIDRNDGMYKPTQALVNRTGTVYENTLIVDGSFEDAIGDYSCTAENSLGISKTVNRTIKCNIIFFIRPPYLSANCMISIIIQLWR